MVALLTNNILCSLRSEVVALLTNNMLCSSRSEVVALLTNNILCSSRSEVVALLTNEIFKKLYCPKITTFFLPTFFLPNEMFIELLNYYIYENKYTN